MRNIFKSQPTSNISTNSKLCYVVVYFLAHSLIGDDDSQSDARAIRESGGSTNRLIFKVSSIPVDF
jgi:hypothetical protein